MTVVVEYKGSKKQADLKALAECTHIALLEGWEESKGANTERTEALKLNLEIMYLKLFD